MTLDSVQATIRTIIQSAIIEQIEDLRAQEEEAREAGQDNYADGIAQAIVTLAEAFEVEVPEEEAEEEEEGGSEEPTES